jgi:hypothetical protein
MAVAIASPAYDRGMLNLTTENFNKTIEERGSGLIVLYYGRDCDLWYTFRKGSF